VIWTGPLLDPLIKEIDLPLKKVDVGQQALEHEHVMLSDAVEQGFTQLRLFPAQQPLHERRELVRIALASDDRPQHCPARDAKDIRRDIAELNVRGFQHLLNPIHFAGMLLNELPPIASQLTQLTEGCRRDETSTKQAVLQQLGNPLTSP
jgi:hypothetical protein